MDFQKIFIQDSGFKIPFFYYNPQDPVEL